MDVADEEKGIDMACVGVCVSGISASSAASSPPLGYVGRNDAGIAVFLSA